MPDRPAVFVHLLPKLIPTGALSGGVAVVIDVLRATTVMCHALAAGCDAVIPCLEIKDARATAAGLPPGTALLGGERGGLPIPGFQLGNSPEDYTPERCAGKTLVMTTTNGTRAILACHDAERVLIAAFVNLQAVVDRLSVELLKVHGRSIHIVCAGTEGFISLEDSLLAGALIGRLGSLSVGMLDDKVPLGNDQAWMVAIQWLEAERSLKERPLAQLLSVGRGGQNVQRVHLERDIEVASRIDRFGFVPGLRRDPSRIIQLGEDEAIA